MNINCWTAVLKVGKKQGNFYMPPPSCPSDTKVPHQTPSPLLFHFPVMLCIFILELLFCHNRYKYQLSIKQQYCRFPLVINNVSDV